jgi:tetratricopeptide (TPR) repeat protein
MLRLSTLPSASRIGIWGTMQRPSSTPRRTWRLQRRWATGRGRARRTLTSGPRIGRRGTTQSLAIKYHGQHLAIAKEVGDRAGEGAAYGNLGNAYWSQGGFNKAIDHHGQHLAIAKEVGDRAEEGTANGNLGNAYHSQGDYAKAIKHHAQHLAIAKEVGDR